MENKGVTVLSLFDGMSCGRIALERAGLAVGKYVASEVDKYAVAVSRANWPDIVQLGSVTDLSFREGVLSNGIDEEKLGKVDLLIGGSPCQSFSFAGSRKGMVTKDNVEILTLEHYLQLKEDGFEFQGQSYLFWEYVRILREVQEENPDVIFLLENVKMAKKWQDLISGVLGVEPIVINSALVSAQNRVRLYWTNLQGITQPEDRGILLKDIVQYNVPFKHYISEEALPRFLEKTGLPKGFRSLDDKAKCLTASTHKGYGNDGTTIIRQPINLGNVNPSGRGQNGNVYSDEGLSPCLTTNKGEGVKIATVVDRDTSLTVTTRVAGGTAKRYFEKSMHQIVLGASQEPGLFWRKLTPVECERLQTVPDNYTAAVSSSQRYKMLGNGWTVDVIAHILKNLKITDGIQTTQLPKNSL